MTASDPAVRSYTTPRDTPLSGRGIHFTGRTPVGTCERCKHPEPVLACGPDYIVGSMDLDPGHKQRSNIDTIIIFRKRIIMVKGNQRH